jgi:translation initiation factor 4B
VDTAAKEREVEAKKLQAIQEKKEADDKAREERKAKAEAAAKAAAEKEEAEEANGDQRENGDGTKVEKILSRGEGEDEEGTSGGQDEDMKGEIIDEKSVKPQEFTREPPRGPRAERGGRGGTRGARGGRGDSEGNEWRRKSSTQGGAPQSPKPGNTSEKVEEDGWSTVQTKPRGGRGRGASRAIAS